VRLSSFDTLLARQDLKVLRETLADVTKSVGTCSSSQCAERGFKDNAASLIAHSTYLSTLQPEASLPGVRQQERSSRCLGAQGLFSETTPSGQRLAGRILQTFPDKRGCVRTVSVPTENGVFKQPAMCLRLLTTTSGNTATTTHIDLASEQPCGLAVTWTVHFLQRQPAATMDNVFLKGGGSAPVATKWSVTLYRWLAVSMDCVFLADDNRIAPVATTCGLPFCR